VLGRPGSVGVGYAGMSQMQTLVTRLGGEVAGYGCIDAIHFSGAPGAGGSQCAYGERTQEQAARSAGVRRLKVTVLRVVSRWSVGSLQASAVGGQHSSTSGPVVLMMKLMGCAPLANERQQPRRVQKAIAFFNLSHGAGSLSTTIWRRPRPFFEAVPSPGSSRRQPLAGRLVR
jgi:hypothetical protein